MIDIKLIRECPDFIRSKLAQKGYLIDMDTLLFCDRMMRYARQTADELLFCRKQRSKEIRNQLNDDTKRWFILMKEIIEDWEDEYKRFKIIVDQTMMQIPNLPHDNFEPIEPHTFIRCNL